MAGDSPHRDGDGDGGLAAGSRVGAYRIEAQAGAGGMAVVYRARDERLGRTVALKVLAPGLAAHAGFRERFIRESRAAAAVDDPHIIPVHEAGEADGVLFIAMRFVSGGDLRSLAAREGPLPADRAAGFVSAAASALDAAHTAGLVHRDVKPANMLIDSRPGQPDHLYLSDFGLSKGTVSSASLTGSAEVFGTPDYLAPEQASGAAVDGRTDQYALACVAFTLLAGVPVFQRDHPMAVLLAHMSAPPPSLIRLRPDLPDAVDQVLAKALAKTPGARYPSCGVFAAALRDVLVLPSIGPKPGQPLALAAQPQDGGASQAVLPANDAAHAQTITAVPKGLRKPGAPAWQPALAAAGPRGNPPTAAITAPGTRQADAAQQAARKGWLDTGRRRAAAAAILLAICLAAYAVTAANFGTSGAHKPAATADRKPPPAKHASSSPTNNAPTVHATASPRNPALATVDVHVVSCPVPAADYRGTPYAPQAAPTTLRLPASLNPPGNAQVFGTTFLPGDTSYMVGPTSASCQAWLGGDGGEEMTVTSVSNPHEDVSTILSPGGLGPNMDFACPYIPAARAADEAFRQGQENSMCNQPPTDVMEQLPTGHTGLYAAAVYVPAGVTDPNILGSGAGPDTAVALYTVQLGQDAASGQDTASSQATVCTLAPAQADVCAFSLKFFLAGQAQISTRMTAANLAGMQGALASFLAEQNMR